MILIVGHADDAHIDYVKAHLVEYGHRSILIDTEDLATTGLRFTSQKRGMRCEIASGGYVDAESIRAVWFRRSWRDQDGEAALSQADRFIRLETQHSLRALWSYLRRAYWMNSIDTSHHADQKPYQLKIASQVGLRVPDTLISSAPEEVLRFCDIHHGDIIYKPFNCFSDHHDGSTRMIYTNRLTRADLEARLESIRLAPCLFQKYVPKQMEIRVVIIGQAIFAFSIDSQSSTVSAVDWRRYDFDNVAFEKCNLPPEVRSKLMSLMKELDIEFGCVDMIVTPDNEHVFLEVNTAGNWLWLEALTKAPISKSIAESLMRVDC